MQMALLSQRSKSTTTFQAIVPPRRALERWEGRLYLARLRGADAAAAYETCERRRAATTSTAPTTIAAMPISTYDGVSDEPVNASACAAAAAGFSGRCGLDLHADRRIATGPVQTAVYAFWLP